MQKHDVSQAELQRYYDAQNFLNLVRRKGQALTMAEYHEIKRQALDGDIQGAYDRMNEILRRRIRT